MFPPLKFTLKNVAALGRCDRWHKQDTRACKEAERLFLAESRSTGAPQRAMSTTSSAISERLVLTARHCPWW